MVDTVIVALPEENDYVNRISSQKKPHMTLMYLGDSLDMDRLPQVVEFIQHLAKTSMRRFGLSVDRRGTLGDKDADVLFFENGWQTKDIQQIQGWLRADEAIENAYVQSKQYAKWTPHLTLGYPETPANEDTRDYPGINYVHFDRIAIWTGESEGPEFRLKGWDDVEMAMSDRDLGESFAEYFMNEEILEHYGVKGMKWGISRDPVTGIRPIAQTLNDSAFGKASQKNVDRYNAKQAAKAEKKDAKADEAYQNQFAGVKGYIKVNNAIADKINPRLDVMNAKPAYKDVDLSDPKNAAVTKAYVNDYKSNLQKALNDVAADLGSSPSGRYTPQMDVVGNTLDTVTWRFNLKDNKVQHAEGEDPYVQVIPEFNELGHVIGQTFKIVVPEDLTHSEVFAEFIASDDEDLMHYGIKGMRWGVTKVRTPTGVELTALPGKKVKATGGKNHEPSEDAKAAAMVKQKAKASSTDSLSNAELKKLIERMQLESSYERLAQQERGNQIVKKMFTEPKYRNQQVEGIQKIYKPAKVAVGTAAAVAGLRRGIKNVDLSNLMDD